LRLATFSLTIFFEFWFSVALSIKNIAFWAIIASVAMMNCGAVPQLRAETDSARLSSPLEPPEIETAALARRIAGRNHRVLIFDTRSKAEYEVSHLEGALWLAPETGVDSFIANIGPRAQGAYVVFYCTMGLRSTEYALKAMDPLARIGARKVAVLKHGILGWANANFKLVDAQGTTRFVHTFNPESAVSLTEPGLARFEPRK
jgi:rhodanese-related sulfurtransferase